MDDRNVQTMMGQYRPRKQAPS